ncbi:Hypothetical predicted protein [Paramuricea clavata]|uniref:Reverse transcriptase RNase H-like domain-containing protein n=1 Tax=Paramuricea clavata TaxID=317549 RepID=A0A6S7GP05_PARCT|nr:Hypothetical predicted protein [Paramuricea clavata]
MRAVNKAIQRERHITPTIDDVIAYLNDAKVFPKLDLNQGYHQLELSEESRYVTTFSTHVGLRRYQRLNFGVTSAAEIFQNTIRETLEGLNGCITSSISPDPRKVEAIRNSQPPSNPNEVRSFLGMANFCARFIPNLATLAKPLRDLTKQHVKWKWTSTKNMLWTVSNPSHKIEVLLDASPVGLETRYSQIEREALAIVWSCHKFHLYLYGTQLSVITDHKPLERLFNDPQSKPPARIERWLLKVQPYRFNVQYQPGSDNPADFIFRHPLPSSPTSREERCAEEYVNFVSMHAVPKALTLQEIKEATKSDTTL